MMKVNRKHRQIRVVDFFVWSVFIIGSISYSQPLWARETYQQDRYTVRAVEGTCKLEIALFNTDLSWARKKEVDGVLGVFESAQYYGELFVLRSNIGQVNKGLKVNFDGTPDRSISMLMDDEGVDKLWKWRYFSYDTDFLRKISKSKAMEIKFYNGRSWVTFKVSLKGSSKAVRALKYCNNRK
ncbi:MAG: hypothetical protein HQL67_02590 [Magnetococcales bacterium]|nr:hypothetical protein [Magnetococcales bacterium]